MDKHTLTNFNIAVENIISEGLFSPKTWTLTEEFETILPSIEKKIKLAFENLPKSIDKEEEFELGESEIKPIDEGTQNPGFAVLWSIPVTYVKNIILDILQRRR